VRCLKLAARLTHHGDDALDVEAVERDRRLEEDQVAVLELRHEPRQGIVELAHQYKARSKRRLH